jgi:hypothetical protein
MFPDRPSANRGQIYTAYLENIDGFEIDVTFRGQSHGDIRRERRLVARCADDQFELVDV